MVDKYMPFDLDTALELISQAELTPYAGGTDLMVQESPERDFVFLNRIPELQCVTEDEDNFYIGSGLTYTQILDSTTLPALLKQAASQIAAPAIRNVATIGGNIANASPKGDGALVCFVADSLLEFASASGRRTVPIGDFYLGRGQTQLATDELLVRIIMPKRWLAGYSFEKVGARKALAISRVSFAGLFAASNGVIEHLAVAFGAVEDVIVRRPQIDAMLTGKTIDQANQLKADYLAAYQQEINPIQGRVSASYRKQVCINLLDDFLTRNLEASDQ